MKIYAVSDGKLKKVEPLEAKFFLYLTQCFLRF